MSRRANDRRLDCIFCKIVAGEINCIKVGESELALAFLDMSPSSDGHTLVIPKNHSSDLLTTSDKDLHAVISLAKEVALNIEGSKLDCAGFNFLSNQGYLAGQRVNHMHLHVIPKYASNEGIKFSNENVNCEYSLEEVAKLITKQKLI